MAQALYFIICVLGWWCWQLAVLSANVAETIVLLVGLGTLDLILMAYDKSDS